MEFTKEKREIYKDRIQYPSHFIEKCLLTFPDDELVKDLLEEKSFLMCALLDERMNKEITVEQISDASDNNTLDIIVKKAKTIKACKELYSDFRTLYDEQYHSKGLYIKNGEVHYNERILIDYRVRHNKEKINKNLTQILVNKE